MASVHIRAIIRAARALWGAKVERFDRFAQSKLGYRQGHPSAIMLGLENVESRRASVLISALNEEEITVAEFRDAIHFLKSEALQVAACILSTQTAVESTRMKRLWSAHQLCRTMAAATRQLS